MQNTYSRFKFLAILSVFLFFYALATTAGERNAPINKLPYLQQLEVRGTVIDQNGMPFPGVSVIIKGTDQGKVTDLEGTYSISYQQDATLVFSYLGYESMEVPINGRREINIRLMEAVTALDHVEINAGYYHTTKRESTGNISRVTAAEIERQPVSNPLAAMQGRMPGVQIIQNSGVPGGGFEVIIRGKNSLRNDGNDPLVLVDGIPYTTTSLTASQAAGANIGANPLNNIDPSSIKSIEVLKDADATAIYGSRGANGVILITTKDGHIGKTVATATFETGFGTLENFIDLMDTEQYLEMRREAFANDGVTPTPSNAPDLLLWDQERTTNWQEELLGGTANLTNARVSLAGGSEQLTFRIGGAYRKETTVFQGDWDNQKFSGSSNLKYRSENDRFHALLTSNYVVQKNNLPSTGFVLPALGLAPNAPELYHPDGSLNWENSTWENPLAELEKRYDNRIGNLMANADLSYKFLPNFSIGSAVGYNHMEIDERQIIPQSAFNPILSADQRNTSVNKSSLDTWILEPKLEYDLKFGQATIKALLGGTLQESRRRQQVMRVSGFTSDALLENIGAGTEFTVYTSGERVYRYRAVFARLNFNYAGKYLLNLTARRDGSSRFGPGKQYANFGAVGAAWIFTEEPAIKEALPFLNFGKLRGSYGLTGSDQIGDYQFMDLWRTAVRPYQNQSGLVPSRLVNPDFAWEENKKLEFGLELSILKDRLGLEASYYRNRSSNQLIGLPLPGATGFSSVQFNMPAKVQNTGIELLVVSRNITKGQFSWDTSLNLTLPKNELLSYPDLENSPFSNRYKEGESLGIIVSRRFSQVNPETGMYEFQDLNDDGWITVPEDTEALGHLDPEFFGGLNNSIRFKNWNLDFFFQYSKQLGRTYYSSRPPGAQSNQPADRMDRWQQPGDQAQYQQFTQSYAAAYVPYSQSLASDFTLTDASYLRLKNLSLSYTLPFGNSQGASSRLFIQGQNLWTLTDYQGMDPETTNRTTIPPLRFWTIGLQVTL